MPEELVFWATVGLVAVVALAFFKLAAVHLGRQIPALADLAAFV